MPVCDRAASPACSIWQATLSTRGCQPLCSYLACNMPKVMLARARLGGINSIVLEDHREITLSGRHVGDVLIVQQISPSLTSSSPASRRSRVLLPQPDGPTSTTEFPFANIQRQGAGMFSPSNCLLMFCRLSMAFKQSSVGQLIFRRTSTVRRSGSEDADSSPLLVDLATHQARRRRES